MGKRSAAGDAARGGVDGVPAASAWFTLALLVVAYIVSFIDRQTLSLLVNPIKADLGISDLQIGLLQGFAFAIFYSVLGIPLGRLADTHSRKHIVAIGVFFWSLMTVGCGLSNSFLALFLFRIGVGVGEATLQPAAYSLLADSFPRHRLVRATSIFALGGMIGQGLAFLLGGWLIQELGQADAGPALLDLQPWQLAFVVVGLPGLPVALMLLLLREPPRHGAGPALPTFAEVMRYIWSRRADFGPLYALAGLLSVLNYAGLAWMPTHAIRSFGIGPREAGTIFGIIHLLGPISGTILGTLMSERLAARGRTDATLITIIAVGAIAGLTYIAPMMPSLRAMALLWFVSVVFQSAWFGSLLATLQMVTPARLRGTNSAVLTLLMGLGGMALGSAAVGAIADHFFAGDPRGIGTAMAITGMTAGTIATLVGLSSRARLDRLLATSRQ